MHHGVDPGEGCCAPALIRIAEREPLLADLSAVWLTERPQDAAKLPLRPGEVVGDVLEAEWTDDGGQPLQPVAYSVGGYYCPIPPPGQASEDALAAVLAKLGAHAEAVESAYRALPGIKHAGKYNWQAREREERRTARLLSPSATPTPPTPHARSAGCSN